MMMKKITKRNYRTKYTKEYLEYRRRYYELKKQGNLKSGSEVFSQYQYKEARKSGLSMGQTLQASKLLKTKADENKFWNKYKKIRKNISRGESIIIDESTLFGAEQDQTDNLTFHYNLSGLLNDKKALHYLINYRIMVGEDREEVLADYGY